MTHTFQNAGTFLVELTVTDNEGATDRTTASVVVAESIPNTPPVVGDDTANTQGGTSVTIDVTENDKDEDDSLDPSTVTIVNGPKQGTVTVNHDGTITYTHNGIDTFTYTIRDANGEVSNVGTVTIQIQ